MKHSYHTGEVAPETGIYEMSHNGHPGGNREVKLVQGERFPSCRECGGREADYELVWMAHNGRSVTT